MSRRHLATTLLTAFLATAASAANLDLTPLHRGLSFNFGNPGARSLGMGGAFIGRADDASAAEANPAGLTVISKSEFTIELRNLDYSQDVPLGVLGAPSAGFQRVTNSQTTPTFLSFAFPIGDMALAAYYHKPLDYEQSTSLAQPLGSVGPFGFFGDAPGDFSIHYRADVFGLSGAWKSGGLSVGLGARYQRFKPASSFTAFGVNVVGGVPTKTSSVSFGRIDGSDSKLSYVGGLKWVNASENLSVGFVYKSGADFEFTECNPSSATESCSSAGASFLSTFEIPPQYGAGISFRPMPGLTVNADVVRIQYDRLLRNFQSGAFCIVGECVPAEDLGFTVDNATEFHAGAEWAFPASKIPFAIRAGWWHDPAHGLEYHGATTSSDVLVKQIQLREAQSFGELDDQNHISFGVGYLGSSFEINAAYDHSSRSKTASISALKRF